MRDLRDLDGIRDGEWELRSFGMLGGETEGCFKLASPEDRKPLRILASSGAGWDHVSVSRADRCPTWEEMEAVKRRFFHDDETAMQVHVPASDHVNNHPFCLHLWRPLDAEIPRPPASLVGLKGVTPTQVRALMAAIGGDA